MTQDNVYQPLLQAGAILLLYLHLRALIYLPVLLVSTGLLLINRTCV